MCLHKIRLNYLKETICHEALALHGLPPLLIVRLQYWQFVI